MKRLAAATLLFLAMASFLSLGLRSRPPAQPLFFPVAVWYGGGRARAPMLEPITADSLRAWREDLLKIKSLGFNTVRTWVEWAAAEPRRGEYHFEQLELILSLAQELGLQVIVQVYADSAPDWVGQRFADGRFVAQNGEAIPSQAAPGFCFDHPGVRQAVLEFYRQAAVHTHKNPAFYAWDLWSEPHIINWAIIDYIPNATFCYCPYTRRLPRLASTQIRHTQGVEPRLVPALPGVERSGPPRFGTILSYTDYMNWRMFITEKLAEDLRLRNEAIKGADPNHVTSSHAAVPSLFTTPAAGDGSPDDWLMSREVDFYGTSFYPKHSFPASHWSIARRALVMDGHRSDPRAFRQPLPSARRDSGSSCARLSHRLLMGGHLINRNHLDPEHRGEHQAGHQDRHRRGRVSLRI